MTTDEAIKALGIDLLRELRAISWFCDSSSDGKMALIPSERRLLYSYGEMYPLLATGCVTLIQKTKCSSIRQYRPAVRMRQFGRQVLVRARAMMLPIDPDHGEEHDA